MPMIRSSGKRGIFIIFHLFSRKKTLCFPSRLVQREKKLRLIAMKLIQHFLLWKSVAKFSSRKHFSGKKSAQKRENFLNVSRLNQAQQQYDKCVNMQIVKFILPFVCDNIFPLISLSRARLLLPFGARTFIFMAKKHCEKVKSSNMFRGRERKLK